MCRIAENTGLVQANSDFAALPTHDPQPKKKTSSEFQGSLEVRFRELPTTRKTFGQGIGRQPEVHSPTGLVKRHQAMRDVEDQDRSQHQITSTNGHIFQLSKRPHLSKTCSISSIVGLFGLDWIRRWISAATSVAKAFS